MKEVITTITDTTTSTNPKPTKILTTTRLSFEVTKLNSYFHSAIN
jgi:hypothetical protein